MRFDQISFPTPEQKTYLEAMRFIEQIAKEHQSIAYIWGGFAIDIYQEKFRRQHSDIDYLVHDLARLSDQICQVLISEGWEVKKLLENYFLSAKKQAANVHLGHIEIGQQVDWKHNGLNGTILFPTVWLRQTPARFYDTQVHVVEPEFEYVIKTNPHLMNPHWKGQEKDKLDIPFLTKLLTEKGIETESLASRVLSL